MTRQRLLNEKSEEGQDNNRGRKVVSKMSKVICGGARIRTSLNVGNDALQVRVIWCYGRLCALSGGRSICEANAPWNVRRRQSQYDVILYFIALFILTSPSLSRSRSVLLGAPPTSLCHSRLRSSTISILFVCRALVLPPSSIVLTLTLF